MAFLVFMLCVVWATRSAPTGSFAFWGNVVFVIALAQMAIYDFLPAQLPILMAAGGLALRDAKTPRQLVSR